VTVVVTGRVFGMRIDSNAGRWRHRMWGSIRNLRRQRNIICNGRVIVCSNGGSVKLTRLMPVEDVLRWLWSTQMPAMIVEQTLFW
jgi:hypothetical protein